MAVSYAQKIIGNVQIIGQLDVDTAFIDENDLTADCAIPRTKLAQDTFQDYIIRPQDLRVWDNFASLLPGTAATDDLAVIEGTFGTDYPTIQSSDAKAATVTQYARFMFALPPEYDDGQSIRISIVGGMITTISDGTATIDVECYAGDHEGAVGSDICATAAQSINSLTKATLTFTITPTGLEPGDVLDVRLTVAITDSATGTAVIGELSEIAVQLDIRG